MRPAPKADNAPHPLDGIEKDGFGIVYKHRTAEAVPGELSQDDLIALFDQFNQRGDLDKCQRLLDRIAGIPTAHPPKLGLSVLKNYHTSPPRRKITRARRGFGGITVNGRRSVRSAAKQIEILAGGRHNCSLITLTVPPLHLEDFKRFIAAAADIQRQFAQWIKRKLERAGLLNAWVWVAEIQPKRWEKWGDAVIHWHFLCIGRDEGGNWVMTKDEIRDEYQRLIEAALGRPVDCRAATRVEVPRKQLSKEMGKYLSKGSSIAKDIIAAGKGDYLPRQWWGWSRPLCRVVKHLTFRATGGQARLVIENLELLQDLGILRYIPIEVEIKGERLSISASRAGQLVYESECYKLTVGYCGFFCTQDWKWLFTTDEAKFGRVLERLQVSQAQMAA